MTAFVVVWAFVVGLCLSGGDSATTVILLPDVSGKVGAVSVRTESDLKVIDQAYHSVSARTGSSRLAEEAMTEAQVNAEYADLLKAQPAQPSSFVLYFVAGSSELTQESQAIIPQVRDKIKEQTPTEINIIGHTDSTGSDEINNQLSLERARAVEKILRDSIPALDAVTVQSFGSKEPLIPTAPNVDEPRNRRVEIIVL